jgi:hypothetical protein
MLYKYILLVALALSLVDKSYRYTVLECLE